MKKSVSRGILGFLAVILVIGFFTYIAGFEQKIGDYELPSFRNITLGLDLAGGTEIVFQAMTEDGNAPSEEDMEVAKTVLIRRLDAAGYTEASVQTSGENRIFVAIPSVTDEEKASALLGKTAVLEFRDADGNVIVTGSDVKSAESVFGPVAEGGANEHHVILELTGEGRTKFTQATKTAASKSAEGKNYIDIVLDGVVQSRPYVDASYASTGINSESVVITIGGADSMLASGGEQSKTLANIINSGRLPFELENIQSTSVGPTLGQKALEKSLIAGLVGLILVMLFMIIVYRVPGVVASIALIFYTALLVLLMSIFKVNLSLPGIAGIILSIGMAVDANVIIFERIKEELRVGKTLQAAIDAGFKRAFTAILDSNITTLIAAVVLYKFGMGTVVGFAVTLGIGVVVSMFTVLVVSRFLLYRLVDMNIKSNKAYGA
ncbi:MAG: protein translocase subunit SecD [Oscillospiraceae bacterium]|nr:protein translocase subunit SecD [Oscillospiraceae bacterium]